MTKNPLELFKSVDHNPIHGNSLINHRARHKLKLTCEEYVIADFIHNLMIKNKPLTYERLKNWIGFEKEEARPIFESLKRKGIYEKIKDKNGVLKYIVTKRYQTIHKIEIDDDFEYFYRKSGKRMWGGSKAKGKELYKKAVKKYGSIYINSQKDKYFEYLNLPGMEWLKTQNITTFLSVESERFNENWGAYIEEKKKEANADRPETSNTIVSREDVDNKFI